MRRLLNSRLEKHEKIEQAKELRRNMTAEEKLLWQRLRNNQLNGLHFRRQQVFAGYILDFYCHSAQLVVEVDGGVHLLRPDYDQARDEVLMGEGLRVLRVKNTEVQQNMDLVLVKIARACAEGGRP